MTKLPGSGPVGSHTHTVSGKTTSRNGGQTVTVQTDVSVIEGWLDKINANLIDLEARVAALEAPVVVPPPVEPPPVVGKSVRVTSVAALLNALKDNTLDEIVIANGNYPNSYLYVGKDIAARTRPIVVRPDTPYGAVFGGNNVLRFAEGAHDQEWRTLAFDNCSVTDTGVVVFGATGLGNGPHHIKLAGLQMRQGIVGATAQNSHLVYFSSDNPHDITIEDYTATVGATIRSALQWYHDEGGGNVSNLVVRRMAVQGTQNAILAYSGTIHDVLIEDSTIRGATTSALNMARCGANVVLRRITSTASGGTYFPNGQPAGLTMTDCVWG